MAIVVMMIIILLNIALLVVVMRVGTQGEHHSELKPEQSAAVMTLRSKLAVSSPAPAIASKAKETDAIVEDSGSE